MTKGVLYSRILNEKMDSYCFGETMEEKSRENCILKFENATIPRSSIFINENYYEIL